MMSATQFSSKMLKNWEKNKAFVGRYDLINGRFLRHLPTKLLHLNVSSQMSAAQFSSKMLKDLKEQRFCRKVWRTQRLRSAPQFSFKMLKNLKEEGFCTKVLLSQRQLSEVFSCKDKLCSFCELPPWWKTGQTPLFTKIRDFESCNETSKSWNLKNQILLSLRASRMMKIYSNTSFDKRERFWTLCSFKNLKM